ncbi:MAG TPA: acetylxylan esterase [Terracidiphilus sp.]|jgi:dienelactone hydrolase
MSTMRNIPILAVLLCSCLLPASAQATGDALDPLLKQPLQSPVMVSEELRQFMLKRVPKLPAPSSPADWQKEAERLRAHELSVIYHGWPREWVEAKPNFEKVGEIARPGYRIVKLRYEIVPGFRSTALLYEPEHMTGKMPAILDVNGHGAGGKAVEHKQKRCINQARRGILALSLEWIGMGELSSPDNQHDQIGLLDLAGANGVGLFYLAMRRGLDYLYDDPQVDRTRIGMTGLSGGGWQTMLLSSLDTRIGPSVPVAGFSSLTTAIEHPEYAGDAEQNAPDMRSVADYAHLMALRAPRPTLLIYNAMDDCCFRAGVVKQGVYTDIQPFFALMGSPGDLEWYVNENPGTHNYQIDSRQQSYRFFDRAFHLQASDQEDADTDTEVQTAAELAVGLPGTNLTIVGLARQLAQSIHHDPPAQADASWVEKQRQQLREVVRFEPVTVTHAWPLTETHQRGLESRGYRFEFSNGLSAPGVLLQSAVRPRNGGTTLLISDSGRASMLAEAGNDVNRGQRVLVFDPLLLGENVPGTGDDYSSLAQMLNTVGERPLGLAAAQVAAIAQWLQADSIDGSSTPGARIANPNPAAAPLRVVTNGPRAETVAIVSAAIVPQLYSSIEARHAIASLGELFTHPLDVHDAQEVMCLDLYRYFDFNTLSPMAAPVKIDLAGKDAQPIFW